MPLYTFACPQCRETADLLMKHSEFVAVKEREGESDTRCETCGLTLFWNGPESPILDFNGNAAGRFQMKAITENNQKIAGHFGREAKRGKK